MSASREQAIKNLKGKTGAEANPNGRPKKGYSITEWFQEMLASTPEIKDEIGSAIIQKAKKGDIAAMKLVWNYMDGLPVQSVDMKTDSKVEIKIIEDTELKDANSSTSD